MNEHCLNCIHNIGKLNWEDYQFLFMGHSKELDFFKDSSVVELLSGLNLVEQSPNILLIFFFFFLFYFPLSFANSDAVFKFPSKVGQHPLGFVVLPHSHHFLPSHNFTAPYVIPICFTPFSKEMASDETRVLWFLTIHFKLISSFPFVNFYFIYLDLCFAFMMCREPVHLFLLLAFHLFSFFTRLLGLSITVSALFTEIINQGWDYIFKVVHIQQSR